MKNLKFLLFFSLFATSFAYAQKIGVVDTNYILSKMPQYKEAEARFNTQIQGWEAEVQKLQKEYEDKRQALENEKVLLVGEQLKAREKEVNELDKKVKNMVQNRFGREGEINQTRSALTKPFQDQIWNAIKVVVEKNNLGIVLDKSNNISVLFLENRYDYTDKVLDVLLNRKTDKETKTSKTKKK